uniref:Uncharacterized protein n=1 Tax=Cacopsylla melanoneura TaxID=428564 RepID=A0A8D8LV26_9HEMI
MCLPFSKTIGSHSVSRFVKTLTSSQPSLRKLIRLVSNYQRAFWHSDPIESEVHVVQTLERHWASFHTADSHTPFLFLSSSFLNAIPLLSTFSSVRSVLRTSMLLNSSTWSFVLRMVSCDWTRYLVEWPVSVFCVDSERVVCSNIVGAE